MEPRQKIYQRKTSDSFALLLLQLIYRVLRVLRAVTQLQLKEELVNHKTPSLSAEIDGGEIPQGGSVFIHLEPSLQRRPHDLAVISLHQTSNHLSDILPPAKRFEWLSFTAIDEKPRTEPSASCLTITYSQLHQAALKLTYALQIAGAQPHSKMLMLIPNGGEYALLLWCCILMRITYVCVDPDIVSISGYQSLREIIKTVKPTIIVAEGFLQATMVDIAFDDLTLSQPVRVSLRSENIPNTWKTLSSLIINAPRPDEESILQNARKDHPDSINSLIFTSGTSGTPKGCPLRVASMCHILDSQSWLLTTDNSARALQTIHNSRGIAAFQTLQTWKAGGCCVMISHSGNIKEIAEAVRYHAPTFLAITPAMGTSLREELARENSSHSMMESVKAIQVGGDAVTVDSLAECSKMFPEAKICVNHGMTEGGGSFTWPFFNTPIDQLPSFGELCPVGIVAKGTTARIWDPEQQKVCTRGEVGHLHIRGANLLRSYLGSQSSESFIEDDEGRWFVTGDTAMIDEEGLVFILGRSKDMIRTEMGVLAPAAIESVVQKFTGLQACVISIQDQEKNHAPLVIVQRLGHYTKEDIITHVVSILGESYALADVFSLHELDLEIFPRNGSGKVSKTELVKILQQM